MSRTWRKIHRRDTRWEETATLTTKTLTMSATYHHTLTLECGHQQIRTGYTEPPKHKVICKRCEKGFKGPGIEGVEPGVFDRTRDKAPKVAKVMAGIAADRAEREKAQKAKRRADYTGLSPREQWAEDKRLGILDAD